MGDSLRTFFLVSVQNKYDEPEYGLAEDSELDASMRVLSPPMLIEKTDVPKNYPTFRVWRSGAH